MVLNKQKGNMYPFVTHTWNPIKGRCPHDCSYCYMKGKPVGELRFDEKCLKDNLSKGNFIFVGSSVDMFADVIPSEWIIKILNYCRKYPNNKYLFQSKNPKRFFDFVFPRDTILGTTIETNRDYNLSKAPSIYIRFREIMKCFSHKTMISIEPIVDFDLDGMIEMMKVLEPKFVSIGADSKGHNLPEPGSEKINALIEELKTFTEVKIKGNLKRLNKFI